MRCEDLDTRLFTEADVADVELAAHVERCLRCQAEVARQRRLRRELGRLGVAAVGEVDGLVDDIIARLDEAGSHRRGRRAVFTVVAAAGAAGAAGAIVVANRVRVRRLAG